MRDSNPAASLRLIVCWGLALGLIAGRRATAEEAPAETRADERAAAALFQQLDANNDGQLTRDEAAGDKARLFQRLIRTSDKDGDERLTADEFSAGLASPTATPAPAEGAEARAAKANRKKPANSAPAAASGALFDRLDRNGDGQVVAEELPPARREGFARLLRRGDADGDGRLDRAEFGKLGPLGGEGAKPLPAGPAGLVAALDGDSDGELSAAEIATAADALKQLDRNGDGKLDAAELRLASRTAGGPAAGAPKKQRQPGPKSKKNNEP